MSLLDYLPTDLHSELRHFLLCTRLVAIFEIKRAKYQIMASYTLEFSNAYATLQLREPECTSLPNEAFHMNAKYASLQTPHFSVFCPSFLHVWVKDPEMRETLRRIKILYNALNFPILVGLPADAPPSFRALADAVCDANGPIRHRAVLTTYHTPKDSQLLAALPTLPFQRRENDVTGWCFELGLFKVEFADDAVAGLYTAAKVHQLQI